jgi:hypothetical protein
MNYQRIYNEIIERAKSRGLNKKFLNGYFEKHHIIPRCMNGSNDKDNLVLLTAREHYLCHWLLWKYTKNLLLFNAYRMMIIMKTKYQNREFCISSRQYEIIKTEYSLYMKSVKTGTSHTELWKINHSKLMCGQNNPRFGISLSDYTKYLKSESMKNFYKINMHPMIGLKHSDETKLKMSKTAKNRNYNPFFGKTHSNEFKEKLKNVHKGNSYASKRCIVNSIEFGSILEAAKYLNISYPTMLLRLKSDDYKNIKYLN